MITLRESLIVSVLDTQATLAEGFHLFSWVKQMFYFKLALGYGHYYWLNYLAALHEFS